MRYSWGVVGLAMALSAQNPARAWNEAGHKVVAQIAFTYLQPGVKADVAKILGAHPDERARDFIEASVWADTVRSEQGKYASWHYINLPYSEGGTAPPTQPDPENILRALNECVRTLKSEQATAAEKAEKLSLLIHFVGDIHQPLHCTNRYSPAHPGGDRGGNDFSIRDVSSSRDLHAWWDSGLGQFETIQPKFLEGNNPPLEQLALEVVSDYPRSVMEEIRHTDFRKWADESYTLAKSFAYDGLKEAATPPPAYVERARPIARKRVALAGYRLAALLNRLYGEP